MSNFATESLTSHRVLKNLLRLTVAAVTSPKQPATTIYGENRPRFVSRIESFDRSAGFARKYPPENIHPWWKTGTVGQRTA